MQIEMPQHRGVEEKGIDYDLGYGRLAKIKRAGAGIVKLSIYSGECAAGINRTRWECPVWRQTPMKTPSQEDGVAALVDMRKMAAIEGHDRIVGARAEILGKFEPAGGSAPDRGVRPTLIYENPRA
jgi:hypothetical protein